MDKENEDPPKDFDDGTNDANLINRMQQFDLTDKMQKRRENYLLRPRAVLYPMVQDTTGKPQKHNDYILINCGKAEITAEVLYGTRQKKLGDIKKYVLKPDEEMVLAVGDELYEVTTIRVTNATNVRAAFQLEGGENIIPRHVEDPYNELLDPEEPVISEDTSMTPSEKIENDKHEVNTENVKEEDGVTITEI